MVTTDTLVIVTSNLLHNQPIANPREDARWIIENWHPDIWGCQESEKYGNMLRNLSSLYDVAIHDRTLTGPDVANPILYRKDRLRHVASFARRIHGGRKPPGGYPARYVNFSHFIDRRSTQSIWYFNTHLNSHLEHAGHPNSIPRVALSSRHLSILANLVVEHAAGNNIAFFGGDFNIDEDADNKVNWGGFANAIFHKKGLQSIYDELKTPKDFDTHDSRKIDVIGSYIPDKRVKAKDVGRSPNSVHSDHRFVRARYEITRDPKQPGAFKTDPADYVDPYYPPNVQAEGVDTVWRPTATDKGPTKDHSECCGGRAT